jgi:FKBP-type peptidyl-prolyl cis-trans isomerase
MFVTETKAMKRINIAILHYGPIFLIPLLAAGCLKNDLKECENSEDQLIQSYVTGNGITPDHKTSGGIYYVERITGTGISPQKDNYIIIDFVCRFIATNMIQETSYDSLKDEWSTADVFTDYVYGPVKFRFGYTIAGLIEGISLMKEGGKATMVIPSTLAYFDCNPLVYDVELLKVIREPVPYEDSVLLAYRNEHGFDESTQYQDIWFKETITPDPEDIRTVQANDTVLLRFTGRIVDGFGPQTSDERTFDTNVDDEKPLKVVFNTTTLTIREGNILSVPSGLVMALDTMREGTHATALLPYDKAFDDDGLKNNNYGYIIVPPFQTVVYDLYVEEIRPPAGK